jgi:two-component system, NtrC family, sensor kinase
LQNDTRGTLRRGSAEESDASASREPYFAATVGSVEKRESDPRNWAPQSPLPGVLVVDDAQANLIAMRALIGDMPCDVVLASSGKDALLELGRREFAVVLLDVMMPGMDGFEVSRRVRSDPRTRDVPIIFLTAMNESEASAIRGYGVGAVDFLFKPVNAAVLRSKLQVFLELYLGRRRLADANRALEQSLSELKRTQAQLVQSAKMASLGEFVAGIAHEINNPLSFAISHLETARSSLQGVGRELEPALSARSAEMWRRAQDRLQEMTTGLERIRDLVIKLRTFSRMEDDSDGPGRVSLRGCMDSVLTILGHRLRDQIEIQTHFDAEDEIDFHPGLLNQVLMNLICNALDAMDGAGRLTLSTKANGSSYLITVEDTGRGIPQALRERVFEPFFTTKPVGAGTGLGLAIAYAIVRKEGGELELDSEEGRGTVATVRLPRRSNDGGLDGHG